MDVFFLKNLLLKTVTNGVVKPNVRIRVNHIGGLYRVYVGNGFVELRVLDNMVGHFFGEFIFTKRLGSSIHIKKKKKKKNKIKK